MPKLTVRDRSVGHERSLFCRLWLRRCHHSFLGTVEVPLSKALNSQLLILQLLHFALLISACLCAKYCLFMCVHIASYIIVQRNGEKS